MSDKVLKSKEERLIELYIKDYISETQYHKMLERIRKERKEDN